LKLAIPGLFGGTAGRIAFDSFPGNMGPETAFFLATFLEAFILRRADSMALSANCSPTATCWFR
jgi:hypothetical protein